MTTQDPGGDGNPRPSPPAQFTATHLTTGSRCPGCQSDDIEAADALLRESGMQMWACRACALIFRRVFPRGYRLPPSIAGGSAGCPAFEFFERPLRLSVDELLRLGEDVLLIARVTRQRSRADIVCARRAILRARSIGSADFARKAW